MPRTGMSADEIRVKAIDATLARMRVHGFEKVRLSDVAKDLNVSHAALYVHFADKAALLDAVTERWLIRERAELDLLCQAPGEARQKIVDWFVWRYQAKRERALGDPALYHAFDVAVSMEKPFVRTHLTLIRGQLLGLVRDAAGTLGGATPEHQAGLLFEAMCAFRHPKLVAEHAAEDREGLLRQLLDVLFAGMAGGAARRD